MSGVTIGAKYRRVVNLRPYESEEIELWVSYTEERPKGTPAQEARSAKALRDALAQVGEQAVTEALGRPDFRSR